MTTKTRKLDPEVYKSPADMGLANIDVLPIEHFDWTEGFGERWEEIRPDFSQFTNAELRLWLDNHCGSHEKGDGRDRLLSLCEEKVDEESPYVPMMNYAYPIQLPYGMGEEEAQKILDLHGGAICLVRIQSDDGEWKNALGLTGGGMDLSQDIVEAYALLGCLPPLYYVRKVWMHKGTSTPAYLDWFKSVCRETCEAAMCEAKRALEHVEKLGQ